MGRSPCCEKVGLKKGPWTPEEDQKLVAYIEQHGHGSWRALPSKAGLQRCGKSCRLRWTNYLRPDIKRGKFSLQEERTIIQLHALLGNRWSAIAAHLAKRTDNEIKNYWNTHLKKRLTRMGIDPITHKPKTDALGSSSCQSKVDAANLSHMAQWESARLDAEARLVRESKLQVQNQLSSSSSSQQPARLILNKIPAQPPCLDVLKAWQSSWSTKSLIPPTKDNNNNNNRMHNMYSLMLAAADDLESPTSTLSFPENLLSPSTTTAGTSSCGGGGGGGIMKEAINDQNESLRYLTDQNTESELGTIMSSSLQDDDIMVAVEAFIAERYKNDVPVLKQSNSVMESLVNDDDDDNVLVYDDSKENLAEENSGILNGSGSCSCNVNFEENKHWMSLPYPLEFEGDYIPL